MYCTVQVCYGKRQLLCWHIRGGSCQYCLTDGNTYMKLDSWGGGGQIWSERNQQLVTGEAGAQELTGTGVGGARAALSGGEAARLVTGAGEGVGIGALAGFITVAGKNRYTGETGANKLLMGFRRIKLMDIENIC